MKNTKKILGLVLALIALTLVMSISIFAQDLESVVLPDGVTVDDFGDNTVTDGTNFYATIKSALEGIHLTDNRILYCKPGADVGVMTHGHVCANLTVYGNGAALTASGEQDFELDTYKFCHNGANTCDGVTGELTLTVKNLNGCGAWGQRTTSNTVNIVFENCKDMNRVYVNGTSGINNITLTNCSFLGTVENRCTLYSNANGTVTVSGCEFKNIYAPINLNHKVAGTQTIVIENTSFDTCGTAEYDYAAPVRVLSSVEGAESALTVSGCSFANTVELTITGGEHGINGAELIAVDSTISISNGTGRGITLNKFDSSIVNSTVTLENMGEGGIRFKTANELTVDADSTLNTVTAHADVAGATVNGIAVTGTEDDMSTVTVANSETTVVNPVYVAEINGVQYKTLAEAIAALKDGDTLTILAGEISEGTIKLPAALKNVTIKGEEGAILKDMILMAYDGNSISYEGITFDGIVFDNSKIIVTGWRANGVTLSDWTITNCTFKNISSADTTAAVHFNLATTEAVNGFTFTNNVIDNLTGGNKSGVYIACTGNVTVTDNVINNVAFRPLLIQMADCDGITDSVVISGNTFSNSSVGRLQIYGSEIDNGDGTYTPSGTDTMNVTITKNIFQGITNNYQVCTWGINPNGGEIVLSHNYFDTEVANDFFWNNETPDEKGLYELGVYPIYTELNEDGTINLDSEYTPVFAVAQVGDVKFESLQEAVDYAIANGGVVTLLDNLTVDSTVVVNGDVVIDLATYTVSLTSDKYNCVFNIENGNVTIKNGTVSTTETQAIYAGLDKDTTYAPFVTLENVTLVGAENGLSVFGGSNVAFNGEVTIKGGVEALRVWNSAVVTVNGGVTIECTGTETDENPARAIAVYESAKVTIVGGKVLGVVDAIAYNDQTPSLTITGGKFSIAPSEYVTENYSIIKDFNNLYVVGVKPTATVNNLGAMVIPGGTYTVWNELGNTTSSSNAADMPLSFVMEYVANESAEAGANSSYADWYADFVISVTGLSVDSFKGTGCYLAGYYGSFGWVKIPIDSLTIENNVNYPVMLAIAGNGQKYDYICSGVEKFQCALYLTPEVLAANPNLKVNLDLCVVDSSAGGSQAAEALKNTDGAYSDYVFESATEDFVNEEFVVDYVAQVGDKQFVSLQEAIDYAAANGGTVTLVDDVIATESINVTGTVTLDLAGYTISMEDASGNGAYLIKNTGDLTIKDSSENGTGKITFVSTTPSANFGYSTSTIGNAGNLTVESGTIENTTNGGASYAIDTIWYDKDISLTINGGKIEAVKIAVRQVPYSTTYKNVVNINGGEFVGGTAGLQTFNTSSTAANLAEVNIKGGTLTGTYAYYTSYTANNTHAGTDIEITGGTFNGYLYIYNGKAGSSDTQFANVTISGGTFNDGAYIFTTDSASTYVAIPSITGGTYTYDVSEYCASGYVCNANEDGTYGVVLSPNNIKWYGNAIILGDSLEMTFYAYADKFEEGVTYYARVIKHHLNTCGKADIIEYIPINLETDIRVINGVKLVKVIAKGIAAKEMTCEISCEIFVGEAPVMNAETSTYTENNGTSVSTKFVDSVVNYATWYLDNTNDATFKTLLVDMLNYGAAAQVHFDHYTQGLANAGLTAEQQALATPVSDNKDDYQYISSSTDNNYYVGTSLTLEDSVYMNFYLKNVASTQSIVVTFTHHSNDRVHLEIYTPEMLANMLTNGSVKITVDDLAPADAKIAVTCSIYEGTVTAETLADSEPIFTAVESIESYCRYNIFDYTGEKEETLREVSKKIVAYSKSAYAYFHK